MKQQKGRYLTRPRIDVIVQSLEYVVFSNQNAGGMGDIKDEWAERAESALVWARAEREKRAC